MFINKIKLKNFRCFQNQEFDFESNFVVIEGSNGSGKTSLLEAIHYCCYLRSFRTRLNKELVDFDKDHFFIQTSFNENDGNTNQIQIGFSGQEGKLVKFNQSQIVSYKDIISRYRIISVTEDDLQLIGGAPEIRRSFLDQSLFLLDSNFILNLRKYKQVLEQRNSFLVKNSERRIDSNLEKELYTWTKQLWEQGELIRKARINFLQEVEKETNKLLKEYFSELSEITVKLKYVAKNINISQSFEKFWEKYLAEMAEKELRWRRSLFGVHIDDFTVSFQNKKARNFASRGQQKLVLFLLKIVQLQKLQKEGEAGCLLLDDFLTDFDDQRVAEVLSLLKDLQCQVFLTCPLKSFIVPKLSKTVDLQVLSL